MMTNDGGPVFPVAGTQDYGLSLLDYFAGQAMNGTFADGTPDSPRTVTDAPSLAVWAYEVAAAMLAEREKRMQPSRNL